MYPTRYIDPEGVGCLVAEHVRCGKPNCRCRRGRRHGPYWYVMYRRFEDQRWRQHKTYVPRRMVSAMRERLEANKARDRSMMSLARRSRRLRGAVRSCVAGRISDQDLEGTCYELQE